MDQAKQTIQNEIESLEAQIEENNLLLSQSDDLELKSLIQEDVKSLESKIINLENSIKIMDGDYSDISSNEIEDDSDSDETIDEYINQNIAILEIRAGTGGDEAGLFALDLYHMYMRFAETMKWKTSTIFLSENEVGGIKTVSIKVAGKGTYPLLINESGVHRVQRVPKTESAGRIHTSAATVAVLPELKRVVVEINPEDLNWDFYRSGGKGGQNVNKVSTAVRVTHIPTGTVVECQEERTQGKNREKALGYLEARLYTMMQEQKVQKLTDLRSGLVGSGDRSEKIRTYNFPQDRVTDHRISKSWHNLPALMNGDIGKMIRDVYEGIKDLNTAKN